MTPTEWLTADEVAAILRMTPDYVTKQCKRGTIPAKKLGNQWRIARSAVDEFMRVGGEAPATRIRTARQRRKSA